MNLKYRVIELLRQAIISLLWFQGTRVLFARLFGVIYDTIFASNIPLTTTAVICVAVIVAFIAPIAAKLYTRTDKSARIWLDVLFVLAVITRIVLSFDGFWLQLIAAILLTGITGSFLGIIAVKHINALVPLLLVGVLLDVVFRSLGNTWDITTQPTTKHVYSIALLLVAVAIIVFDRVISRNKTIPTFENQGQFTGGAGLAIGAGLFLITILSTPNVVMRWTGVRFEIVTAATLLVLALSFQGVSFSNPIGRYSGAIGRLSQSGILLRAPWYFVAAVGSLFVAKSVEGLPSMIAYMLALLVALIGINRLNTTSYDHDSTQVDTKASATLAWGLFLFFIIQLLWAFTFTYAHTIPAMRDKGVIILLVCAALTVLPAAFRAPMPKESSSSDIHPWLSAGLLLIVIAIGLFVSSQPPKNVAESDQVTVATLNMHYGFDKDWNVRLDDQLEAIKASGADVVFLQEVDSGRITSFQVDHAYWLASELGWHQLFAPTLEGLSGIAMISRYPLQDSSVEMLTSSGEQTALASARIRLGSQSVALHTMWLGLDTTERMIQINDAVSNIKGDDLAILGGDFNSEPGSAEIELIKSLGYSDIAVDLKADDLMTDPAVDPDSRIDYLFSRGLEPITYSVWPQVISDHRMVVSNVQIP